MGPRRSAYLPFSRTNHVELRLLQYMWQSRYTLEPELMLDRYHVQALREKFTRKLPIVLPDILDEVAVALREYLGTNTKGKRDSWFIEAILTSNIILLQNGLKWRHFPSCILSPLEPPTDHLSGCHCVRVSLRISQLTG